MRELKSAPDDLADGTPNEATAKIHDSDEDDGLIEDELGDDLTPEEMGIARLAISVTLDTLTDIREI